MLDVEGSEKEKIFSKFEKEYEKIKNNYTKNNILYRPNDRKIALAYKNYSITQSKPEIIETLIKAWEEFQFLTPIIDKII